MVTERYIPFTLLTYTIAGVASKPLRWAASSALLATVHLLASNF